jgi:hypothetical protein
MTPTKYIRNGIPPITDTELNPERLKLYMLTPDLAWVGTGRGLAFLDPRVRMAILKYLLHSLLAVIYSLIDSVTYICLHRSCDVCLKLSYNVPFKILDLVETSQVR